MFQRPGFYAAAQFFEHSMEHVTRLGFLEKQPPMEAY